MSSRARIAANPRLADETVDLPGETGRGVDPDDTASLTQPTGLWGRLTEIVLSWKPWDAASKPAPPASGSRQSGNKGRAT
jgi:hypothetical protein